jgi:hypothetical protein
LAAEQAERTTAWEEAARHYERCLTLVGELEGRGAGDAAQPTEGEAALLLALGRCWRNAGEHRAAWRSLMRAIELYHARDDGVGHARATLEALEIFAPPQRQAELVRAALRGLGEDDAAPQLAGRLLALLLDPWRTGRREAEEAQLRKRVERLVACYGLAEVPALLTFGDAWRGWLASDFAAAATDYRRAHVGLAAQGQTGLAAQALFWNALSLLNHGRLETGTAAMEEALSYAQRPQLRFVVDNAPAYLAGLQLAQGRFTTFDALVARRGPAATWVWDVLQALRSLQAGEAVRAACRTGWRWCTGCGPGCSGRLEKLMQRDRSGRRCWPCCPRRRMRG